MNKEHKKKKGVKSFSPMFWLVIMFEFFERGAYYGMMSFLSVYFVSVLDFPKENVGVIKGVIQPLLYFLPIISGALADRFGYRKLLMTAFSLLGLGYFFTSQTTSYGAVFASLVVMGFGAGTFKPLISGTIAKITDEENSTLGFGIYYWSINIGAFLFPLVLVPYLKALNPRYVIIASAICTASMLIPTIFFFKDPTLKDRIQKREQMSLIQTLAHAFEIIYSPIVLLFHQMRNSAVKRVIWTIVLGSLTVYSFYNYLNKPPVEAKINKIGIENQGTTIVFEVHRNMLGQENYSLNISDSSSAFLTVYKPVYLDKFGDEILQKIHQLKGFEFTTSKDLQEWVNKSDKKIKLIFTQKKNLESKFAVDKIDETHFQINLSTKADYPEYRDRLFKSLSGEPVLAGLTIKEIDTFIDSTHRRPFFLLFVIALILSALAISLTHFNGKKTNKGSSSFTPVMFGLIAILLWIIPGLSVLSRIISTVIYASVSSLFIIDKSDTFEFGNRAKFLLMIFLYSGFWVVYFQMFDSVLWYVQAYVDASSLNHAINGFLNKFGLHMNWFFDVEHVTVINAGTIILLQLIVSSIVKKTKALPTMMFGIGLGTLGMIILAVNTNIWVFLAGISIFSIGEMTAHPKFLSYIGSIAPKDKKAMYMGYVFLYGVFGSSIGGVLGAKLYVHFVDYLNQPKILWLIFSSIGVFTIIGLALYNKFLAPKSE